MTSAYDVIIVGYGPVGMIAANIFGMYGLQTLVIEKKTTFYNIPRAIHFDDEVMRIFQYIGLEEEILKIAKPIPGLHLIDKHQKVLFQITKGVSSGWDSSYLFYQPELEFCLHQGAKKYDNVEIKMGVNFSTLSQSSEEVKLSLLEKGEPIKVKGKYLIGCDGANSTVRNFLKIPMKNLGFSSANLKMDIITDEKTSQPFGNWIQKLCEPKLGPYVFLNSRKDHLRWEFSLHKKISKNLAESPEFIQSYLSKVIDPGKVEIKHVAWYQFKSVIAKKWRFKRIFLAGDAAHQMPPYIGQGMAAGIRDISNLGWKIKHSIRSGKGEALLESYQKERYWHALKVILLTILVGKLFISNLSFLLKLVSRIITLKFRKIKIKEIPLSSGFFGKNKKTKGKLFLQPDIILKGHNKPEKLDKILGKGFAIISLHKSAKSFIGKKNIDLLSKISCDFFVLNSNRELLNQEQNISDINTELENWFLKNKVQVVILRPDRYIFDATSLQNLENSIDLLNKKSGL
ncbi:MAG: bifunctional 3-(3-hydroxy-phenyl)propionate/3-hydroxycinnamic acid hydroxylase [Flammeovirgaceae bacterium]|nr:bifunctional 3-(3-hydroxy-phenyl)propionate/3-hydroxycinnamic acid hydroxylase [Flammeovirgaceae bacterium]